MSEDDVKKAEEAADQAGEASETPARPERDPGLVRLESLLFQKAEARGGALYAVLDAARSVEVLSGVVRFGQADHSLYRGLPEEPLSDAAPYLVRLEAGSEITTWLLEQGWGRAWGVFLVARTGRESLRAHLSGLVSVETEEGEELYFRFYDPRVLRTYLTVCTEAEIDRVLGPVLSVMFESEDGRALLCHEKTDDDLALERQALDAGPAEPETWHRPFARPAEDAAPIEPGGILVMRCLQLEAFRESARDDFEQRLVRHIEGIIPGEAAAMPEGDLKARAGRAVDRALGYGIEAEKDVFLFAEFTFELGEDFGRTPECDWALDILEDQRLNGRTKVQLVRKMLAERDPDEPASPFAVPRILARAAWA
ncbi:MAG: DUF4123 domain-containing protein [Proteobacteria bacterium]|nr:DUF4123 domain-containing protein [Pseudomonadota bacterium]